MGMVCARVPQCNGESARRDAEGHGVVIGCNSLDKLGWNFLARQAAGSAESRFPETLRLFHQVRRRAQSAALRFSEFPHHAQSQSFTLRQPPAISTGMA
jgi:hypothetical protein